MATRKILMIVGDFVEDYEVMVPFQALSMVGHRVDVVCPGKSAGDKVKTAVHDFEGDQTYTEKPGHLFHLNKDFAAVNAADYDALVIPGGRSPEYLRLNEDVLAIVRHFFEQKKPVAAICHAAQLLLAAGVLKGREATAYFSLKPDLINAGAKWIEPSAGADNAHSEGNLVSAVAWPGHVQWLKQFLELLGSRIEA